MAAMVATAASTTIGVGDSAPGAAVLALSDIIHTLSPSPPAQADVPNLIPLQTHTQAQSGGFTQPLVQEQAGGGGNEFSFGNGKSGEVQGEGMQVDEAKAVDAEDESPEPLTDEDVGAMKRRLVEMGLTREDGTRLNGVNTSSREGELVDMVLRLIRTPVISPSQLAEQASAIGSLQGQLEFLSSVVREERSRWQSEREGWDRMAEALIRQRNKPGKGATPDEELERKCSTLEADNRILKHRLQETHNRASLLEGEIMKLKPLLLMLPSAPSPSPPVHSVPPPPSAKAPVGKGKKRKQDTPIREDSQTDREPTPSATRSTNGQQATSTFADSSSSLPALRPAYPISATATAAGSATSPISSVTTHPQASTSLNEPFRRPEGVAHYPYPYAYNYSSMLSSATSNQAASGSTATKSLNPYLTYALQSRIQGIAGFQLPYSPAVAGPSSSSTTVPSTVRTIKAAGSAGSSSGKDKDKGKKRGSGGAPHTLSADARTEHILLASRKIGRERAALVAGVVQHAEKEKERYNRDQEASRIAKEAEKLDKERLDRIRNGVGGSAYYRTTGGSLGLQHSGAAGSGSGEGVFGNTAGSSGSQQKQQQMGAGMQSQHRQSTFVYVRPAGDLSPQTQTTSQYQPQQVHHHTFVADPSSSSNVQDKTMDADASGAAQPQPPPLQTPRMQPTPLKGGGGGKNPSTPQQKQKQPSTIQTPLDSLVSAALSIQQDGTADSEPAPVAAAGRRRKAAAIEAAESPVPKRRRTSGVGANAGSSATTNKPMKIPSALDVLADQAQAAVPIPQKRGPGRVAKDKEREREGQAEVVAASANVSASVAANDATREGARASVPKRRSTRGKGKGKEKEAVAEVGPVEPVDGEDDVQMAVDGESEVEAVIENGNGNAVVEEKPSPVVEGISVPLPKKRGRPRKEKKDAPISVSVRVRGSGRAAASATSVVEEESANTSGRRRRAPPRDRTIPLTASASVSSPSVRHPSTSVPPPAPRRGRPPKVRPQLQDKGGDEPTKAIETRGQFNAASPADKPPPPRQPSPVDDGPRIIEPPPEQEGEAGITHDLLPHDNNEEHAPIPQEQPHLEDQHKSPTPPVYNDDDDAAPVDADDGPLEPDASPFPPPIDQLTDGALGVSIASDVIRSPLMEEAYPGSQDQGWAQSPADAVVSMDKPMDVDTDLQEASREDLQDQNLATSTNAATLDLISSDGIATGDVALNANVSVHVPSDGAGSALGTGAEDGGSKTIIDADEESRDPDVDMGEGGAELDYQIQGITSDVHSIGGGEEHGSDRGEGHDRELHAGSSQIEESFIAPVGGEFGFSINFAGEPQAHPTSQQQPETHPQTTDAAFVAPPTSRIVAQAQLPPPIPTVYVPSFGTQDLHAGSQEAESPPVDATVSDSNPPGNDSAVDSLSGSTSINDREVIPLSQEKSAVNIEALAGDDDAHDSDLDAEAEDYDEDRDAEGEDEDPDGSDGHWQHISFSSTEISKTLSAMEPLGDDEDADADAEGEIEDESDGPPEAVFRPSELIPGAH